MSGATPTIGFIGAGKLAAALAPALESAGYPVRAIASRSMASAQRMATALSACEVLADGSAVARAAELVFLTVPDGAIESVADGIEWRAGQAVVHCSGALELDVLAPAVERGALAGSFHPLQTFAGTASAPIDGITIAVDAQGWLLDALTEMARAIGGSHVRVPTGRKAIYHASAALASNYLIALLVEAAALWRHIGADEAAGLQALLPLVRTTLDNLEALGPERALTGPVKRGDGGTIRKHLDALHAQAPDLVQLYAELARRTIPLSHLEPGIEAELASILDSKEKLPCA